VLGTTLGAYLLPRSVSVWGVVTPHPASVAGLVHSELSRAEWREMSPSPSTPPLSLALPCPPTAVTGPGVALGTHTLVELPPLASRHEALPVRVPCRAGQAVLV